MSDLHRRLRPLAMGAAFSVLAGCAGSLGGSDGPAAPGADLSSRLDAILADPPLDRVHWGILVVEAGGGRVLYERNADLLFIPGSNTKVPAVASGLDRLGEDFRWETSIYARARPDDGTVVGDLYLVGRGDPSLGPPFHESGTDALLALGDSMVAAGIERVAGRLVVDVSAWDSTTVPDSWMVEDLPGTAGATGGAFSIDRGQLEIRVTGGDREGAPPVVSWTPSGRMSDADRFVRAEVVTSATGGEPDLSTAFRPEAGHWILRGTVPPTESQVVRRSARAPVRLASETFHQSLIDRGIEVGELEIVWEPGTVVEDTCRTGVLPSCPGMLRLAGIASPPLSEIAAEILGPSQNWLAEQLLRTLGAEAGPGPGGWPAGIDVMSGFLIDDVGLSEDDFHLEDGSGLSNHNLISPRALVELLRYARRQPWGETWVRALASPGEVDSTLENRLVGLEGRIAAKTGSLSHVNSLSGYVEAADGRTLAFSVLSNGANLPASAVRAGIDRLLVEIADP